MSAIEGLLNIVKNQKGLKGLIKHSFFKWVFAGFEAIDADLKSEQLQIEEQEQKLRILENKLESAMKHFENQVKKVEFTINKTLETGVEKQQVINEILKEKIEKTCDTKVDLTDYLNLDESVQKLIKDFEKAQSDIEVLQLNVCDIRNTNKIKNLFDSGNVNKYEIDEYSTIDYFDFENHFRGSIEEIKKRQEWYLEFFRDKRKVLDFGCGRGEFLSLLKDNAIEAIGVDIYKPYIDYCLMQGLNAKCMNGVDYLVAVDDYIDGIFVGQVVEHLEISQILLLCKLAYKKLPENGCLIIETPNPTSLAIYTHAFYIDPSHKKPVHPLTMKYFLEKAGFRNIEIIYTQESQLPCTVPKLKCENCENIDEFNNAMQVVSDFMFGSQDYAIVAIK